jgi:hypothetical protein
MSRKKRLKRIEEAKEPKITAWSLFVEEMKPKLEKEKEGISKRQIYQELTEQWENQKDEERLIYEKKAKLKNKITLRLQKQYQQTKSSSSEENTKKMSAYSLFVEDKQTEIKSTHPELTLLERAKIVTQLWRTLDQNEKYAYLNKAKCVNRKLNKGSSEEENSS